MFLAYFCAPNFFVTDINAGKGVAAPLANRGTKFRRCSWDTEGVCKHVHPSITYCGNAQGISVCLWAHLVLYE